MTRGGIETLMMGREADSGRTFALPVDALVQTFAVMGIRGSGKTTAVAVLAEEFSKAGLPWIMLDPVGVGWGLRAGKDGKPGGGLPVVVFGGSHGDLPLDKDGGRKVAVTAECKEAVERLVRLGRNQGYGCSIITQRPATVDKDILSQAENLVVMRTVGKHDRKALMEWLEPKFGEQGFDEKGIRAEGTKLVNSLAALDSGVAYFWSPHWLKQFKKVRLRDRTTFHPGQTRSVGKTIGPVTLSDVTEFVEKVRRQFSVSKPVSVPARKVPAAVPMSKALLDATFPTVSVQEVDDLKNRVAELQKQIAEERVRRADAENRLAAVRKFMGPQYEAMKKLFEKLGTPGSNGAADPSAYAPWLEKAGKRGTKRLLEIMIDRGEVTRTQLATLAGLGQTGTFRNYLSWLKSNSLVEVNGETVRLRPV